MKSKSWIFPILFILYFFYFFQNIGSVSSTYWDETFYVNAARSYLDSVAPYPNPEHTPFGKETIAFGISLFGDTPTGWRFFSVLFGALSGTLVSYFVFRLTRRIGVALFVAALIFLEPIFVVHFRMALLEAPLTSFLILSTLLTYLFYSSKKLKMTLLFFATLSLGFALATKLLALVFFPFLWALIVCRLWREELRWRRIVHATLLFALVPLLTYTVAYWILGYSTSEVIELTQFMIGWHKSYQGPPVITSSWFEWLYIKNPLWYFVKMVEGDQRQAVMATGNFVLWIGAEIGAIYALIRHWRRLEIWMLALLVIVQFALYTMKQSTYIYYMTEILPFLFILFGVAIGDLFDRYGKKYKRVLQIDFGLFFIGALVLFLNYWPYLWGAPMSKEKFSQISGRTVPTTTSEEAIPSPSQPITPSPVHE